MNIKLKLLMVGIGIIMLILISGCVEKPQQEDKLINTSSSAPFFPTEKEPATMCMNAELVGKLVIENDCLRASGYLLIWPYGFSLSTDEEGVIQIIDDTGQPIARVGDKIELGGGESTYEYDRCPCPCWNVCKYGITSD